MYVSTGSTKGIMYVSTDSTKGMRASTGSTKGIMYVSTGSTSPLAQGSYIGATDIEEMCLF
jgi:hypothetical protein